MMITLETYTVSNLKPDTSYVFLVRAENSHGMSPPTQVRIIIISIIDHQVA